MSSRIGQPRWAAGALLALAAMVPSARATAAPDDPDRTLSAAELTKYFEPYAPAVRACFSRHGVGKEVTGELRLEFIIQPDGKVLRFGFRAPGVERAALRKLDACLRNQSKTWSFPVRKGYTTAVLPFFYQRTSAPGAGPIESCWDVRGCPPGKTGPRPKAKSPPARPDKHAAPPSSSATAPTQAPRGETP